MDKSKRHLAWWGVGALAVAAVVAWWLLRPAGVPEGFAVSNGRIEATEVDIASKIAGRIDTILVKEGQFVREGEVLAAGGRVLNMVDLSDVYMTFFLPTEQAGTLKLGGEARLILDAAPDLRIPATISFVASVAQFTPKTVETSDERLKLMFRVKARIPPELLQQHLEYVKTGLPGVAWVRVNEELPWPDDLVVRLPQ
ncbi:HlyD family efflux transporter periplasmic adaptor subunit [Escherichia coli]|nr:HlyD family efflux transporter periplasmic adaptor subunit [Escherichia coli]